MLRQVSFTIIGYIRTQAFYDAEHWSTAHLGDLAQIGFPEVGAAAVVRAAELPFLA